MSDSIFRLPPYAMTGGRTRSEVELAIESIITTVPNSNWNINDYQKRRLIQMCINPLSIAEISASMNIALQVIKILVSDLIQEGYLQVSNSTPSTASNNIEKRPDLNLLNKVLDGLQNL